MDKFEPFEAMLERSANERMELERSIAEYEQLQDSVLESAPFGLGIDKPGVRAGVYDSTVEKIQRDTFIERANQATVYRYGVESKQNFVDTIGMETIDRMANPTPDNHMAYISRLKQSDVQRRLIRQERRMVDYRRAAMMQELSLMHENSRLNAGHQNAYTNSVSCGYVIRTVATLQESAKAGPLDPAYVEHVTGSALAMQRILEHEPFWSSILINHVNKVLEEHGNQHSINLGLIARSHEYVPDLTNDLNSAIDLPLSLRPDQYSLNYQLYRHMRLKLSTLKGRLSDEEMNTLDDFIQRDVRGLGKTILGYIRRMTETDTNDQASSSFVRDEIFSQTEQLLHQLGIYAPHQKRTVFELIETVIEPQED